MHVQLLVTVATVVAAAGAQTPPCESRNDTSPLVSSRPTATPFVGLNPSSRAYQFSPASQITVQSGAIFTAPLSNDDFMRIEIWDEDTSNQAPGNRLCVGTAIARASSNASWIGTNFDFAPTLNPGTNYWFVWIEPGNWIVPEEPGGIPLPRRTRATTNPWGSLQQGEVKFRLFCNLLDGQGVTNFGQVCPVSNGQLPGTFSNDAPQAGGGSFVVQGTNMPPSALAVLVIGVVPNWPVVPLGPAFNNCFLNVDLAATVTGFTGLAEIGDQPLNPRPTPFGFVRYSLPLGGLGPGAFFSAQILVQDAGAVATVPIAATNAIRVTTF